MSNIEWVAHRGYTYRYPENTEIALTAAADAGARYVEIDVQLTADGVAVLFHDQNLQRLCGRAGAIHQLQSSELKNVKLSAPERFGYRYAQNPIMTLQQFFNWLTNHPQVNAFVELKRISLQQFGCPAVLDAVIPLLVPLQQQVTIISYDLEALAKVRADSLFPVGAVFDQWHERKQKIVQQLKPEYLFCDWHGLPRWGRVKNPWGKLAIFECTDLAVAKNLVRRGVDLIETFAIGEMISGEPLDEQPLWH